MFLCLVFLFWSSFYIWQVLTMTWDDPGDRHSVGGGSLNTSFWMCLNGMFLLGGSSNLVSS